MKKGSASKMQLRSKRKLELDSSEIDPKRVCLWGSVTHSESERQQLDSFVSVSVSVSFALHAVSLSALPYDADLLRL
eukprot:m.55789 g.55789  ORF g.55789 m.55789 type:complete len:77 (-) comp11519_c0_seq4:835-1065(-)